MQSHDEPARTLRDYPLSLRQSARAVFGSACEGEDDMSLTADTARARAAKGVERPAGR